MHGDTGRAPYGMDTYGSRSLAVGGQAIKVAGERLVEKARIIAAHQLEVSVDDVEFNAGTYSVKGDPEKATTIQAVAFEAFTAHNLPDGVEPTLSGESTVDPMDFSYPHGTHLAAIEVDTETGQVTLRRIITVDDAGRVLNPLVVEGQRHGGIAQGVGQALLEEVRWDPDGNPVTSNLADYGMISATELPAYELILMETPTPANPLGAKGIGESGAIGATPALHNAVVDALAPFGVRHLDLPTTPQRVWQALQDAAAAP